MGRLFFLSSSLAVASLLASFPALSNPEITTYKYDELGRLIEATESVSSAATDIDRYCFDKAGNRTQHYSDIDGTVPSCPPIAAQGSSEPMLNDPEPASAPPPNNAPDPSPDYASGSCLATSTIDLLVNDTDADGDPLQLVSLTLSGSGSATAASGADGLAAIGFGGSAGTTVFSYVVADDQGGQATGLLTVETVGC